MLKGPENTLTIQCLSELDGSHLLFRGRSWRAFAVSVGGKSYLRLEEEGRQVGEPAETEEQMILW